MVIGVGNLNFSFDRAWLYALLVLIPYIIIYLTKPKPRKKTVPSLMFLMTVQGRMRKNAFLNRLLRNFLFFLQLTVLSLLALALSSPVVYMESSATSDNVVVVIDASASMAAQTEQGTRFEQAARLAKEHLGRLNSIVVAEHVPVVVLRDSDRKQAASALKQLRQKGTSTNLGDAMVQAEQLLGEKAGSVVVLSDFSRHEGADPLVAMRKLVSKRINVEFVDLGGQLPNVGFISLTPEKENVRVQLKNYYPRPKDVTVVMREGVDLEGNRGTEVNRTMLSIEPGAVEQLRFPAPTGMAVIEILEQDPLPIDNMLYLSYPQREKAHTLLITNRRNPYLASALLAIDDLDLQIAEPPTLPDIRHELIVVSNVFPHLLLPGMFKEIKETVNQGSALIIAAQDDLSSIDTNGLLPVSIASLGGRTPISTKLQTQLTQNIDFGSMQKHLISEAEEQSAVYAEADDSSPLLTLRKQEHGTVFYYGIFDEVSDFRDSPDYPLFWYELTGMLIGRHSADEYHRRTIDMLRPAPQGVETPFGTVNANRLLLDEPGFYTIDDSTIAVNILDSMESDITFVAGDISDIERIKKNFEVDEAPRAVELFMVIVLIAGLGLIGEIAYLKRRGDL